MTHAITIVMKTILKNKSEQNIKNGKDNLYETTVEVWSDLTGRDITLDEAEQIISGFQNLINTLLEWDNINDLEVTKKETFIKPNIFSENLKKTENHNDDRKDF